jgi:hypothetical protein
MLRYLKQARSALSMLNPDEVRERAERRVAVGLVSSTSAAYADMERFPRAFPRLARKAHGGDAARASRRRPGHSRQGSTWCSMSRVFPAPPMPSLFSATIRTARSRTSSTSARTIANLGLALARNFYPFRKPVVDRVIASVARENAIFAIASALPNVLPSLLELPWSIGEFASDTAFITMNQVRMAFLVAAASDKKVGYAEQKAELLSILGGAFGWRALARELVSFIPLGGGLLPKGAIAYAATYVLGKGLEHFHGVGYGYTRAQRRDAYQIAYERGKEVVTSALGRHAAAR